MSLSRSIEYSNCAYCGQQSDIHSLYCCSACEKLHQLQLSPEYQDKTRELSQIRSEKFSYFDSLEFKEKYAQNQSPNHYVFYIEGLECASCVHLIERLPEFCPDVLKSELNFTHASLSLEVSSQAKLSEIAALIEELGYKAYPLNKTEKKSDYFKAENRKSLMQIAVAGACAGNIMLFVVPLYSGLTGGLAVAFAWLSFILFLPILFYSAVPLYKGAWQSLRFKTVNIELPITIAFLTSFFLSTLNLIRGSEDIYFDSTAGFIFFILSSRYLLKKVQQHLFLERIWNKDFLDKVVSVFDGSEWVKKPIESLRPGDFVKVCKGQKIPCDGKLKTDLAYINTSVLTGESLPLRFHKNMPVQAGTENLTEEIIIEAELCGDDTQLGKMLNQLESQANKKTPWAGQTEKLSQYLILVVFSIAAIYFFLNFSQNFQQALNRSLALIVIACPCALAFGVPLAQGLAIKKAKKQNILIKNPGVFEKLSQVQNIFLDKTGTLTRNNLQMIQLIPPHLSTEHKAILLGLEAISQHPIAHCLRREWTDITPVEVLQIKETLGQGVSGVYQNRSYEIRSSSQSRQNGLLQSEFFEDGKRIAYLYFADQIHPESPKIISFLKKKFSHVAVISGDQKSSVEKLAKDCGLSPDEYFFNQSPQDKVNLVEKHQPALMIGDGANDSLALQKAYVSIAVRGSIDLSLMHSDIYFTKEGLSSLVDLFRIASQTKRTIQTNILISLVYNTVGGLCALSGLINPWMAALLMPFASTLLIVSTFRGLK